MAVNPQIDETQERLAELDRRERNALQRAPGRQELVAGLRRLERRVRAGRKVLETQPPPGSGPYLDALFFVAGDLAGAWDAASAPLRSALDELVIAQECEEAREAIDAASATQLPEPSGGLDPLPW